MGNIDNYILMTKPKNLDSMYGEYLRRLMLLKLNNPDFRVPKILREKSEYRKILTRKDRLPNPIWIPPEIRHTDFSQKIKQKEEDLNPRELRKARQMEEMIEKVAK
jgi:large subunit ribosomal protein L28